MNMDIVMRYRAVGFDQGFENPRFESKDVYPEYIKENVEECIAKIKAHQTKDTVTFAFMTDLHYLPLRHHDVLLQRNLNAYRQIRDNVGCDKLILGGDYIIDTYKDFKLEGYSLLSKALSEFHYLPVHGNHDSSALWDKYLGSDQANNKIPKNIIYDVFYSHLPKEGAVFSKNERGLYYYIDDEERNLRYIMTDICDVSAEFDKSMLGPMCISQEQVEWLANEALMTTKDIMVFGHSMRREMLVDGVIRVNGETLGVITKILDAYKNGGKIQESMYENEFALNVDVDFTNIERGNVLGVFAGHFHNDIVEYTESGIPLMFTGNFNMAECRLTTPRVIGDKTEMLYDIVTLDRKERTFYITRVGAGEDRIVKY